MTTRRRKKRIKANDSDKTIEQSHLRLKQRIEPKTEGQAEYIDSIQYNDITLCCGPAGSGKTLLAVYYASIALIRGDYNKIILTRPAIEVGKSLGYLPGSSDQKLYNYLIPLIENFKKFLGKDAFTFLKAQGKIEIVPVQFRRGRNFDNSLIIMDEAENANYEELKLVLTRIGERSKMILSGDFKQSDIDLDDNDFEFVFKKLSNLDGVGCIELTNEDIVRNPIISKILIALGE